MSARSRTIKLFCPSLSKLIPLVAVEEQRLDLGSIARTFGLDPASLKLNGHFVSRGVDLISSSVTWKSLLSFFSSRGLSTGANDADALIVDGKLCKAGTKMQISRAEARAAAAAAERQAQLKEARARDVQQKHPKGKKRGASTSQALPRKKPRSEGPTIEAVQALEAPCHGASPLRASSLGADFRSPRGSYSRAKVGFVPRWSIKEGETLTIGRVARELVQKGSLPGDVAEAQSQGTKAMITSTCVFMAAAQNQVGQLTIRTEALARDLEESGHEKSALNKEHTVLLKKVEHLEAEFIRAQQESDRKLRELEAQMVMKLREAETRAIESYKFSEDFREVVKRAIAPGFIMGATDVRDWVLKHHPEVSFEGSDLIFEDTDATPTATDVVDGEDSDSEGEGAHASHEVPLTLGRGDSDADAADNAGGEAIPPVDAP